MAQFDQVPSLGDKHYEGDVTWEFDGTKWVKMSPIIKTENILLSDPTHPASLAAASMSLPDVPADTDTQLEANRYYMSALRELDDSTQGIHVGENPPTEFSNGTLWYDSTADVEKLKIYYDPTDTKTGTWVDGTPVDLSGVTQDISDLTERVDTNEEDIEKLETAVTGVIAISNSLIEDVSDLEDAVSDIQTLENTQQGQIDTLENKVEALEGSVIDAKYTLSNRPDPNSGEYSLVDNGGNIVGTWAAATKVKFYNVDDAGNPHNFDNVGLDDLMRVGGLQGSAVYKIKSLRGGADPVYEFDIEVVTNDGQPWQSLVYDFEFTPGFDASAYATKTYVDDQDALKVNKTGDTMTGKLILSASGQANDDGVRLYMKDTSNNTNLTLFPSGLVQTSNTVRVNKDSGDAYQVKDAAGSTIKMKIHSEGYIEAPKLKLTGSAADINFRVIDVKSGQAGRLAYNALTKLSWGASNVWIGSSTTTGEAQQAVNLNLQNNTINNVGLIEINATDKTSSKRTFQIKGTLADGTDASPDFFYSYHNATAGTPDAVNYNGKIVNGYNLVNKDYVDTKFSSVSTDTLMPKAGGTFTGKVTFNAGTNSEVDFVKSGNNDILYKGTWIVSFQGNDSPKIKLNTDLNVNDNYIANVKDPASDKDAVNRQYLKGARVTGTSSGTTKNGGFYQSDGRLFYKLQ